MRFPNLKIGDAVLRYQKIVLVPGGFGTGYTLQVKVAETVTRLTATQGTTDKGNRFKLSNGLIIGSASEYFYPEGHATLTSAEEVAAVEACAEAVRHALRRLSYLDENDRHVFKHVLNRDGLAEGMALLGDFMAVTSRMLEGFKK